LHHPHGSFTDFRGKLVCLVHGFIFSGVEASAKPGAVHPQDYQTLNVEALGQEIGQRFDQWQHSAPSAQSAEAVVPVESDQVVASDKTS